MSPKKKKHEKKKYQALAGGIDRYSFPLPFTLGVISDTHIFVGGGARVLPIEALELFQRFEVDLIVHAGDIVIQPVLDRLADVAPVLAVYGNNEPLELWKALPERLVLSVGPYRIGVVHGHGGATARAVAKTAFDEPMDLVIYGHSHIPMIEESDGVVYFNPGSATDRRWAAHFGIGIITIDERGIRPELILFDSPAHLVSIDPQPLPGANE